MSPSKVRPSEESSELAALLGPELAAAFAKKGYSSLTKVQEAVLADGLEDRDLRISSQTGSGKTVALGLSLRGVLIPDQREAADRRARALVIVPTRELAAQVHEELGWLYAPVRLRVAVVTGGASYRDEHRALAAGPHVIVGTPGRLLDHITRGAVDCSAIQSVVLDEADRMLDLGFREELETILAAVPAGRRTHLVSATFARDVTALADRVQKNAVRVEGTPLGSANTDIDHVLYLVEPRQRVDALINVLLEHPQDQTLVFARTRADVADIARELQVAGFSAGALTGDMEQAARVRALGAFKRGQLRALVATDVAARGIDVQDVTRVVQVDPPSSPEPYIHRSGRTGRAGRKGTSIVLVPPSALRRVTSILQQAKVRFRTEPVPTAASIRAAQDERWLAELAETADDAQIPERVREQAARIVERGLTERALSKLLLQVQASVGEPREVTVVAPRSQPRDARERPAKRQRAWEERGERNERTTQPPRESQYPSEPRGASGWVPFKVSWGEAHGADPRRLVAMLCRRGQIQSSEIGAIRIGPTAATVEVAATVAERFAVATREPDARDPRVRVTPAQDFAPPREPRFGKPAASEPQRFNKFAAREPRFGQPPARESSFGTPPAGESLFGKPPVSEPRFGKPAASEPRFGKPRQGGQAVPKRAPKPFPSKPFAKKRPRPAG